MGHIGGENMWEFLYNPVTIGALTILGRNLYGWAVNSFKDGKLQGYEIKQLGQTLLTVGGLAVFAYYGINSVADISPEQATMVAALVDILRSVFKGPPAPAMK